MTRREIRRYETGQWGLDYRNSRYGSPVGVWNFWQTHHWP